MRSTIQYERERASMAKLMHCVRTTCMAFPMIKVWQKGGVMGGKGDYIWGVGVAFFYF